MRTLFFISFIFICTFCFAQNKTSGNTENKDDCKDSINIIQNEIAKKRVLENLQKDDEKWEGGKSFDMLALLKKNKEAAESFHKMIQLSKADLRTLKNKPILPNNPYRIGYIPGIPANPTGYGFW